MRTKIIDYRGFEISFDTDSEKFYIFSDSYDREYYKPSFASAKKFIDDFIKDNNMFKPFLLMKNSETNRVKIRIIGLTKDNRFIYEDENEVRKIMSKYDETDYITYIEGNDTIFNAIDKSNKIISQERDKIKELKKLLKLETAKDIKEKMLSEN